MGTLHSFFPSDFDGNKSESVFLIFLEVTGPIWRRIVRIQREFLWGGVGGGKKVNWVKWESMCQIKKNGGLGVKDIRVMNVSLLAKWR